MNPLGQFMEEFQQEAAGMATGQLRSEIQVSLDVLAETISHFQGILPGAVSQEEMTSAVDDMMGAALVVSLYLRELITRPPDRFLRVRLSCN